MFLCNHNVFCVVARPLLVCFGGCLLVQAKRAPLQWFYDIPLMAQIPFDKPYDF